MSNDSSQGTRMRELITDARPADLDCQAQLGPYQVSVPRIVGAPREILLTGVTGFLGAFLLHELLGRTTARLHCVVRARSTAFGLKRIEQSLATYGLPVPDTERLSIVKGDLAQPRLALPDDQWQTLTALIDTVVHNGARVHWVESLESLHAANVGGTRTILELAAQAGAHLHHISSIAVFPYGADRSHTEADPLMHDDELSGGYAQSKWIAERLVTHARDRGLRVAIYRPGTLSGASTTGHFSRACITDRMLKSAIELGVTPEVSDRLDIVPVDYAASAIAHLAATNSEGTFHLTNPSPIPTAEVRATLARNGYEVENLSFDAWKQRIFGPALEDADEAMRPFRSFFAAASVLQLGIPRYRDDNTKAALRNSGISCPPLNEELLRTYLDRYQASGWIAGSQEPKTTGNDATQ
jgi:myxalamid-type nonribosomal peptide synthetase MxaA